MARINRWHLKRLERAAEEEQYAIPQLDGTIRRFPASQGMEAFMALMDGRDHPLAEACRNSSDPRWSRSFYTAIPPDLEELEDLSEQAQSHED